MLVRNISIGGGNGGPKNGGSSGATYVGVLALVPFCFFNTTFSVPFNWASGLDSSWQGRSLASPVKFSATHLKLQHPGGNKPAQLAEWELKVIDPRPVALDLASALASGEATVSRSTIDSALIGNLFDGNTNTVVTIQSTNPVLFTLTSTKPKRLPQSRVYVQSGGSQWRVETADTVAELDAMRNVPFRRFKASFIWYGVVGCGVTLLVGWLASMIFSLASPGAAQSVPHAERADQERRTPRPPS